LTGARRYIAGAPERLQKRGRFGTFNSGMDFQAAVDEMIVAAKKSDQPVDTSYRMEHQPTGPMDENPIRLDDLTKTVDGEAAGYPDDFYTPQGQRIYAQGPSFEGDEYGMANVESYKAINSLRGKPDSTVTIYRGVPDDPSITTINEGDFVTLSKKYAELHAASGYGRSGDEPGKVISQEVKAKDVYWDGNDVNEFGYFPESATQAQGSIQERLQAVLPEGSDFRIEELDGAIRLNQVVIPKEARRQGSGSAFMQELVDYADENNLKLVLTAAGDFGGSKTGQMRLYKRFGFKENKGRNKDFEYRDSMIREPQQ
jgi:GNAT superfamily N-acetyltransferase